MERNNTRPGGDGHTLTNIHPKQFQLPHYPAELPLWGAPRDLSIDTPSSIRYILYMYEIPRVKTAELTEALRVFREHPIRPNDRAWHLEARKVLSKALGVSGTVARHAIARGLWLSSAVVSQPEDLARLGFLHRVGDELVPSPALIACAAVCRATTHGGFDPEEFSYLIEHMYKKLQEGTLVL